MANPDFTTEEGEEEVFDISPDQVELTLDEIKLSNVLYNKILNNPTIQGGTLVTGSGDKVLKFNPTDGLWLGNTKFSSAPFRVTMEGALTASSLTITGASIDGTSTIGGRVANTLASAIDASGHFADSEISTASSAILGSFTFGVSGALQIGTYQNGATGDIKISPTGILGRDKLGNTTFSINGETGVAALNGLVVGTNVGIGTAEDSAGVTTIVGDTVTTAFVNALSVTAGSISASDITAGTIDAGVVTISNLTVGTNVGIGTAEDSAGVTTIVGATVTTAFVNALSVTAGSIAAGNITAGTIDAEVVTISNLTVGTNVDIGTAQTSANVTTIVGNTITSGYISALSLVVGTEIGLGTAQTAANVTTIVGNTVTTAYVNALNITADSISASDITAGTIDAEVVTISNLTVGTNVDIGTAQTSANVTTIVGDTVTTAYVNALNITADSVAAEDITGTTITGINISSSDGTDKIVLNSGDSIDFYESNAVVAKLFTGANYGTFYSQGTGKAIIIGNSVDGIGLTIFGNIVYSKTLVPLTTNSYDLGSTNYRWDDLFLNDSIGFTYATDADINSGTYVRLRFLASGGNIEAYRNFAPAATATYTLGTSSKLWNMGYFTGLSLGSSGIDMNNNNISEVNTLGFDAVSSNPGSAGQMCYYVSGGTTEMRVKVGGTVYSINLTAV